MVSDEALDDEFIPNTCIVAFVFDIDGVLVKGAKPLPGATEALKHLQDNNIPFMFLTNGGGKTEQAHVENVGMRLRLKFDVDQFVQSHTPYLELVNEYKDKTVLVLGGQKNDIRIVAKSYGFQKVITSSDLYAAYHDISAFSEMSRDHHLEHGAAHEIPREKDGRIKVSAIFVFSSPRDWALDNQVIIDLLLSEKGYIGTRSPLNGNPSLPNNGYLQDDQPTIHYCNLDRTWPTSYKEPRFAQGLFRAGLNGIWAEVSGGADLTSEMCFGKPTEPTYVYAEKTLQAYHEKLHAQHSPETMAPELQTIYMVGDNPLSDIQGANNFESKMGAEWESILVETGVHAPRTTPIHTPTVIVKGVKEAVEWGLKSEKTGLLQMKAARPKMPASRGTEYRVPQVPVIKNAPADIKVARPERRHSFH